MRSFLETNSVMEVAKAMPSIETSEQHLVILDQRDLPLHLDLLVELLYELLCFRIYLSFSLFFLAHALQFLEFLRLQEAIRVALGEDEIVPVLAIELCDSRGDAGEAKQPHRRRLEVERRRFLEGELALAERDPVSSAAAAGSEALEEAGLDPEEFEEGGALQSSAPARPEDRQAQQAPGAAAGDRRFLDFVCHGESEAKLSCSDVEQAVAEERLMTLKDVGICGWTDLEGKGLGADALL